MNSSRKMWFDGVESQARLGQLLKIQWLVSQDSMLFAILTLDEEKLMEDGERERDFALLTARMIEGGCSKMFTIDSTCGFYYANF